MTQMCTEGTPLEDHTAAAGLWVKREDMCCPGGPNFSKTRGVFAHVASRPEHFIGVLDTSHSQGGWAVARACSLLNKQCVLFYPVRKAERGRNILAPQQQAAADLGAQLMPLAAGRSAILYHRARKWLHSPEGAGLTSGMGCYMMPNALKLPESVTETALEMHRTLLPADSDVEAILVSASSATIAAGLVRAQYTRSGWVSDLPIIVHLGYSRSHSEVRSYIARMAGCEAPRLTIIDEGYSYADRARPGVTPPFPCNEYYDLKALRWWVKEGRDRYGQALFWNIG